MSFDAPETSLKSTGHQKQKALPLKQQQKKPVQKRVLIVDDDPAIRNFLSDTLTDHGYLTKTAKLAKVAIKNYKKNAFDVIISDIRMPHLKGTEFLKLIKSFDDGTSVILITGYEDIETARQAVRLGAHDYFIKPFKVEDILASVQKAVEKTRALREKREYQKVLEKKIAETTRELEFQTTTLKREQQQFYGIIKSANFGLLIINGENNKVILLNKEAEKYLHLLPNFSTNFFDEDYRNLFPANIAKKIENIVDEVRKKGTPCTPTTIINKDNLILEIRSYPVLDEEKLRTIVVVINDITERKKIEQSLLISYKLAGIGELVASIAHEINNPISFTLSNTKTLNEYVNHLTSLIKRFQKLKSIILQNESPFSVIEEITALEQKIDIKYLLQDIVSLVAENIDGLCSVKKIIKDLKTLTHIDDENTTTVNLNEIIETALGLVEHELKYKAKIIKQYGDLPTIEGYTSQLSQVIINILINAAHAIINDGEIQIKTFTHDNNIYIEIKDNGCGIPEEKLPKIFNPFFTTKQSGRGTGLGLSIAMEIVQKHGGNISVSSRVGRGTTFTITLPINKNKVRTK